MSMQNEMILSGVVNWLKSYVTFHDDGADSGPGIVDSEAICLPSVAPAPPDGHDSVAIQEDQQETNDCMELEGAVPDDGPPPAAAAPPALEPGPEAAEASDSDAQHGQPRHVGRKVHQTPSEIMQMMKPCDKFGIFIDKNAHRFKLETKVSDPRFVFPYKSKTFNRSFANCSWKSALELVHEHVWQKWKLVKDTWPCDKDEQEPGAVPEEVFEALAPIIAAMPEA